MSNPYEVDVSKEDIAITGMSQAEAEFFGVTTSTGREERMSAAKARGRRSGKTNIEDIVTASEEALTQVAGPNLIVNSPRHLWGLGSFKIHYRVANADVMADALHDAQEFFEWIEEEFADRLADVAALENQISVAQKELLTTLAEEIGEDLPNDLTDYSKTEASKLIQQLINQRESKPQRTTSRRSRSSRRPTSRTKRQSSSRRAGTSGGRGGRRTGGGRRQFDNTKPGGATDKMKDFLLDLCKQAGVDVPTDDQLDNEMTYDDVSAEITELREALGYGDN